MKHLTPLIFISSCLLMGASSLYAAPPKKVTAKPVHLSQRKLRWKLQNNSLPAQSGPGIVICEPVTADTLGRSFGSGCALWLQMNVGGQPQLGKTPLWNVLARASTEMGRPDLRLSSVEALNLAPIFGVTHAAVGTLRGMEPHLTLTYRLLQVPAGTPVGAPVILTGTREQIAAGLPQAARTLVKNLGVTSPDIPASTDLTPADLESLGQIRWQKTALTDTQQASIEAMAAHSPLAGLMNLSLGAGRTAAHFNAAVQTLLTQAGGNSVVWGEIAGQSDLSLLPHATELAALAACYPGNYILAAAETHRYRVVQDRNSEMSAAKRVITDAPHNPDGWLTYASTLSLAASSLRQGRFYNALTSVEADTLSHLYPQWEAATQRAVQLDPAFAKGWLRLAESATFNADPTVADHALKTALVLSDDKPDVYGWALEMYQPKWNDDPVMLAQIAKAAANTTMGAGETVYIAGHLRGSGYPDLQKKVLNDFVSRRRTFLTTHPNDGASHWGLAMVLEESGDQPGSLKEYQAASALLPENAGLHYSLGSALYSAHLYNDAIAQFQEAVRIDPDYSEAHFYLGYGQKYLGRYEDAKQELKTALRLNPAYGNAYAALGEVFDRQNNFVEAALSFQAAIRFGADSRENYDSLTWLLTTNKQYDEVITTGEAALRIYKDGDAYIYNEMANAYLTKKEWEKSLAMSNAALALNANDPLAHENLAEAYIGAGRTAEAQAEWRKVLTYNDARLKADAEGYLKKYP